MSAKLLARLLDVDWEWPLAACLGGVRMVRMVCGVNEKDGEEEEAEPSLSKLGRAARESWLKGRARMGLLMSKDSGAAAPLPVHARKAGRARSCAVGRSRVIVG